MALLGRGVLAIWNGIAPEAEADFVAWHVAEHIPERVGLPGFLRGRRYVAGDGRPKYFNFYETESVETLQSPVYLARLDDPTAWTRRVVAHFRDTSRTVCDVALSLGRGEGAWIEAIQLQAGDPAAFVQAMRSPILPRLAGTPGVCGVHLLQGRRPAAPAGTAEAKLRGAPDATADWILLIEAVAPEILLGLRAEGSGQVGLAAAGAVETVRGLYGLQFSLSRCEMG